MHKLRTLSEYKRPGGWRFQPIHNHTLDSFRERMEGYKTAAKAHQVLPLRKAAK